MGYSPDGRRTRSRPPRGGAARARGSAVGCGARGVRGRARRGRDARRARRARPGAVVPGRRRRRGSPPASAPSRATCRPAAATTPRASASGSRTSTSSAAARRRPAAGWRAPSARVEGAGPATGRAGSPSSARGTPTSVEECAEHAERAMDIARDAGAGDLEVFALSLLGRSEVRAGRTEQEWSCSRRRWRPRRPGRVRNVHTLAEAYCNLIMACTSAGEWERADGVVRARRRVRPRARHDAAARRVPHDPRRRPGGHRPLAGRRAARSRARWRPTPATCPRMGAPTVATLAELRVRQGRLRRPSSCSAGREEHPSSLRALAQLRIAEGSRRWPRRCWNAA